MVGRSVLGAPDTRRRYSMLSSLSLSLSLSLNAA